MGLVLRLFLAEQELRRVRLSRAQPAAPRQAGLRARFSELLKWLWLET